MAGPRRSLGTVALGAVLAAALLTPVVSSPPDAFAAVPPDPNPPIEQSCGLELTLVLDASGSVSSAGAVDDVREAGDALLSALKNTNSTARVTQFATLSELLAPRTLIDDASMADGGALGEAIQGYYNPRPGRPSNVNIYSYDGSGDPTSSGNFNLANNSVQYTNWDQAMNRAGTEGAELLVFVTDGDPTAFDFDQANDPFRPQDVAVNTDRSQAAAQVTLDRAVEEANQIKAGDTRVLAVGVGSALNNNASRDRLTQISGPQVVRDADLANVDDLNDIDVALVTDFEDLAAFMRSLVLQLCSPSLTVRKLAQTADDATFQPEEGRDITVTPTVPGGDGFDWILPEGASGAAATVSTDANGFAGFQWEPIPPEESSTATVAEATSPEHTAGRPGPDNDYRCELRNEDNDVRVVEDDFADPADPSFVLDPIEQEIVTCTIWNSFDYAPGIALEKVNAPTEVRGDLVPPTAVTSTYTVTNPGNTPLSHVTITDDRCGPVQPVPPTGANVGDTDGDGLLDPGEEWQFTCTQPVRVSRSTNPAGQNIVNTAEVIGLDPAGTQVTDEATDDVDVFTPFITLEKTVNGADQAVLEAGETATYSYVVSNAGNTPLADVDLTDDTEPCTEPTLVDDGNGDAVLDVGESWTYECAYEPDADVVNTADVTAVPLNPVTGDPFPTPNPPVTDTDTASVVVISADIHLTKTADPDVVLLGPGQNPPGESVTYTFQAENLGTSPLGRPGGAAATDPGWVVDPRCDGPAVFQSGDTDGDQLLDPGETWVFTCTNTVDSPTLNVAEITGQPTDADGNPLPVDPVTDAAAAFVRTVQPALDVTKTAVVPVVLDPGAPAVDGPDVPTPRPAGYRYEIGNPGDVPLDLGGGPVDDKCAPLTLVEGDTNGDSMLDPGEVWVYTCQTVLDRDDADSPPGDQPALVENTVQATGTPFFDGQLVPEKQVTGSDTSEVTVIEPSLELTKTVSATVVSDRSAVTYTVTIENTGTSGLKPTAVSDDKCALTYESGDTDDDGILDGADTTPETWTFTCTRTITAGGSSSTDTNVASVTALDQLGNTYTDSDDATVRVITPAIELTKAVDDELVPAGTPVTYTFEVRNVGTSDIAAEDALEDVVLVDLSRPPLPAGCLTPELVAKDGGNQDDVLEREPEEVWIYQCTAPITRPTTNIGVVRAIGGRPVGLEFPVEDFAPARVQPFRPGINVEKTANPTRIVESGQVTYTYRVTNTGDVPLANVAETIADDTCSPVRYVRGDLDNDGLLDTPRSIFEDAIDETWVFECVTTVDEDTTNVVTVSGSATDQDGNPLCEPAEENGSQIAPCEPSDRDRAHVAVVDGPDVGPGGGGDTDPGDAGTGDLGDTGAPPGLYRLLLLGLLLVAVGSGLIAGSRRQQPA